MALFTHPDEMCATSFRLSNAKLPGPEVVDGGGCGFSRAAAAFGSLRMASGNPSDDVWYNMERFQLDHVNEVVAKLDAGEIDDEIWGKIIVMERGKRVAKAYLRKTTIIVDGGAEEFDGQTLGFNQFENPLRDDYTEELRSKIGDGVIIKMDNQGNIKAMARGSTPIVVQGTSEPDLNCISERLIREQGRLKTRREQATGAPDEERIAKIFDMRRFKSAIAREMDKPAPNGRELLLKTCVRIALVKDGGSDPMKTPCWFMIINLVALDMLKTKVPHAFDFFARCVDAGHNGRKPLCKMASLATLEPIRSDIISQRALSGLITAALQHANDPYTGNACDHLSGSVPVLDQVDQLAHFANSLRLARSAATNKRIRRNHRRSRSCSGDTDESLSSEGFSRRKARCQSVVAVGTTSSSASSSGISAANTKAFHTWDRRSAISLNAVHEDVTDEMLADQNYGNAGMHSKDSTFYKDRSHEMERDGYERRHLHSQHWSSFRSTTSDYDSSRELYDSAPCCSISGASSVNLNRCQSSPLLSESERTNETPTSNIHSNQAGANRFDKSSHSDNLSTSMRMADHNPTEPPHAVPIQSPYSPQLAAKGAPSMQGVGCFPSEFPPSRAICTSATVPSLPRIFQPQLSFPANPNPLPPSTPHVRRKSKFLPSNPFAKLFKKDPKQNETPRAAPQKPVAAPKPAKLDAFQQHNGSSAPFIYDMYAQNQHRSVRPQHIVEHSGVSLWNPSNMMKSTHQEYSKHRLQRFNDSQIEFSKVAGNLRSDKDVRESPTFITDVASRNAMNHPTSTSEVRNVGNCGQGGIVHHGHVSYSNNSVNADGSMQCSPTANLESVASERPEISEYLRRKTLDIRRRKNTTVQPRREFGEKSYLRTSSASELYTKSYGSNGYSTSSPCLPSGWEKVSRMRDDCLSNDNIDEMRYSSIQRNKITSMGADAAYEFHAKSDVPSNTHYNRNETEASWKPDDSWKTSSSWKIHSQLPPSSGRRFSDEVERRSRLVNISHRNFQEMGKGTKNSIGLNRNACNIAETETIRGRRQQSYSSVLPCASETRCVAVPWLRNNSQRFTETTRGEEKMFPEYRHTDLKASRLTASNLATETNSSRRKDGQHITRLVVD